MNNKYLVLPLFVFALAGCTMIPDYARPDLPVSNLWSQAEAQPAKGPQVNEVGWRDFFLSDELRALIQKGLENNRDLRVAALNIDVARAQYRVQRSNLMPGVNAGGSLSRQYTPETLSSTGNGQTSSTYNANIASASYEIDLFGRLRSLNQSALEQYFATEEARAATQIALVAEIANAYLQLLADREQQLLSAQTLSAQQASHDIAEQRYNVGIGSQLDLSQARTLLETARVDSIAYARVVQQDRNALQLLVGAPIADSELAAAFADADRFVGSINPGLPSDLLQNRPDIREAEHALLAANANIGAARAAFFPSVTLTASGGTAGTQLSQLFGSGSGLWSFAPQITLPIFEGGRNVANLDIAEARKSIAVAQYEKSVQVAFRDVANALIARQTMDDELAAQQQLVDATDESRALAEARYEQGVAKYLDVLDAQRSLYAARQQLILRRLAMLQNYITFYKALGGGQVATVTPSVVAK